MSSTRLYLEPASEENGELEPKYHVRLPVFDGPLDLLLHLIRKNEVDIYDIPIAEITKQYLEILELMEELNLAMAGEFLVLAATLIHIKSKMLLPPPHEDGTEDEPGGDPREELVARLLEYQRYKEAAQLLHQQETVRNATWTRPESVLESLKATNGANGHGAGETLVEVDLFQLISAFREVLDRVRQRTDLTFEREVISIEEMIERLKTRLSAGAHCSFVDLFEDASDRSTVIVTFLAILEMVRLKLIRVYQAETFSTIHVTRLSETSDAGRL